jgi:hypothetical protein
MHVRPEDVEELIRHLRYFVGTDPILVIPSLQGSSFGKTWKKTEWIRIHCSKRWSR